MVRKIKAKEEESMSIMSITETLKDVIKQTNQILLSKRKGVTEKDLIIEEISNQLVIFATLDLLKEEFLKTSNKLLTGGNQTALEIFKQKKEDVKKGMGL